MPLPLIDMVVLTVSLTAFFIYPDVITLVWFVFALWISLFHGKKWDDEKEE